VQIGKRLDTPVGAPIVVLVDEARQGRLAVCAGAGLSRPAGILTGPELARKLHERFQYVAGYSCTQPDKLLEVADAAARLDDGLTAVQRTVLELAPFDSAPAQLGHQLLALLVAEDALRLLLTNWDDCVERSWRRVENIPAARNKEEAEMLRGQFVLKIHGCCTEADTLLVTSEQLREPGFWTKTYFGAELMKSTMVFVGVGDIADYAQKRIKELAEQVEHAKVRVVSLNIVRDWEKSEWKKLLPDLPEERRIETSADDFLDELAREWVMHLVREVRAATTPGPAPWLEEVTNAFMSFTALQALEWLRRAAVAWRVGESVAHASCASSALEAIGLLARQQSGAKIRFLQSSAVLIDDQRIDVLLHRDRRTTSDIEYAAVERARQVGWKRGSPTTLTMLCAASSVRGPKPRYVPNVDVVDPDEPVDDILGAGASVDVSLVFADELLEAA
jgi:hypothetical protein